MQTQSQETTPVAKPGSVMGNRSFAALLLAQLVSNAGDFMHSLALIWLMNLMTAGSALWMSMIAVMQIVPKILFGPFIGVLVDRWPKLLTMRIVDLTSAVLTGTIALLAFSQTLQPWELLVLTFLLSTASNFFNPAKQVLMTHIVSKEQLMAANSISQTIMTLCMLGGPVLAGILIGWIGPYLVFALDAASFVLSFLFLAFVRDQEPQREKGKLDRKQFMEELGDGFRTVKGIAVVRAILPFGLFVNFLFAPMQVFITKMVTDVYHGGAQELSYIEASFGVGMLIGSVLIGLLSKIASKNVLFYTGLFGFALSMLLFAASERVMIGATAMVLSGMFNILVNVTLQTVMQESVPQEKMGRVFSLIMMGMQGSQPLSNFAFGLILNSLMISKLMVATSSLFLAANFYALKPKALREMR